jgi:cell division transport system permease protein
MAAFMVLFFTLFISTTLFMTLSFFDALLGYVETRPQVTVYFQTKADQTQILKVRDELMNTGKVSSVKYVSKEEAFQIYKQLNKDNPLLLDMVSSDILPPSLEIYAKKASYLSELATFLKTQPGVDEVHFQKDIVDRLLTLTNIMRKGTLLLFSFLIGMSVVVLTTTTLFKIALRKEEIELLRLLGASSFYIRKPFINEGLFFGLFANICSFLIIGGTLLYFSPFLNSYLRGIPTLNLNMFVYNAQVWPINIPFMAITFCLAAAFGMGIALVATFIATDKYLK